MNPIKGLTQNLFMKKRLAAIICLSPLLLLIVAGCKPAVPSYPEAGWDFNKIVDDAKKISDDLDAYIEQWESGSVSGNLPLSLVPDGENPNVIPNGSWVILDANKITDANTIWLWDVAQVVDHNKLHPWHRDCHATYLLSGCGWMPFGYDLKITGQFPHCRFFDIQVNPPFNPYVYEYGGGVGEGEVSIVDVDIEPDAGSTNIFRIGADHNAVNRNYTVTYQLKMGNQADFADANYCPRPPYYRGAGNTRYGGLISYQGPWGDPNAGYGKTGRWCKGTVWLRYYGPDNDDMLGKAYPVKLWAESPRGKKVWINCDFSKQMAEARSGAVDPGSVAAEPDDTHPFVGSTGGWSPQYGIFLAIAEGTSIDLGFLSDDDKKYCRDIDKGVIGRGLSQPAPGNWKSSLSCVNYYMLMNRGVKLGSDKVWVYTGKLPTYPDTRPGNALTAAQVRYFSFCTYDTRGNDPNIGLPAFGYNHTSLLDDEIVIDANRKYIICYSTMENKPTNATSANGVTWVYFGKSLSTCSFTIRWVSVYPDWYMSQTPDDNSTPWNTCIWSSPQYDPNLMGMNRHDKLLGWYLPKTHYMTKTQFEHLSLNQARINPDSVRTWWVDNTNGEGWVKPYGWTEKFSTTTGAGGIETVNLSNASGRYVMIDMSDSNDRDASDPNYGYFGLWELEVKNAGGTNLALNKPTFASDEFFYWDFADHYATDGDATYTRWGSNPRKNTWIYVDLGSSQSISNVVLKWYSISNAKKFKILVSDELM